MEKFRERTLYLYDYLYFDRCFCEKCILDFCCEQLVWLSVPWITDELFTTTNESELIFIEATRFEPIVLHRISICFVGESRHGRAYIRAVLHRFGLDQPSRTKVWQLLSTWRVAIKIVTFLFSVNPANVVIGQRGHLHIKLPDSRHAR